MNPSLTRRMLVTGGLAAVGLLAMDNVHPPENTLRTIDTVLGRPPDRDPLSVAMLDVHADRMQTLLPELELLINRRISVEARSADDLYAAYTIDLLQQTGRFDVVSMVDAWMPYFGRRGYLADVPNLGADPTAHYPANVAAAAQGIDGSALVAYPWTLTTTCCLGNAAVAPIQFKTWSDFFQNNPDDSGVPTGIALGTTEAAAMAFRATMLSFGEDLVAPPTNLPTMDSYAANRSVEILRRLARRTPADVALRQIGSDLVAQARAGTLASALFVDMIESRPLWPSPTWRSALVPPSRFGTGAADLSVWMLGIPAGAPNLETARLLVELINSPAIQMRLWPEAGLIPTLRDVLQGEWAPDAAALEVTIMQALGSAVLWPRIRSFRTLMQIAGDMVRTAMQGGEIPTLLAAAQAEMLAELTQENELSGR
ncbi:MAG TPA: extracellular solute-binding protein [Thermomicrobiales bacterium]|nr:extracellular solute-binding protein [Thermomicrobiales bacterium]